MAETIFIKAKPALKLCDLREYFGLSGPLRAYHTKRNGFPSPNTSHEYDTADVVSWFRCRGKRVEVI